MRARAALLALAGLAAIATAARSQTAHDVAAYLGTVRTTTGATTPVIESPMLGDSINTFGLQTLYTHVTFGDFGETPFGAERADVFGGGLFASIFGGRLGVTASAAYLAPDCPIGLVCRGNGTGGGSVTMRLANAAVGDPGGRVTSSLRAAGGWSFDAGSDRYASATVGAPIAFSAQEGRYRIAAFLSPGMAWGSVKTTELVISDFGDFMQPFDHSGARGMLSGGVGFVPDGAGVGVHIGFEKVFMTRGGAQFGAALSWSGAAR